MASSVVPVQHVIVCCALLVAAFVDMRKRIIPFPCVCAICLSRAVLIVVLALEGESLISLLGASCVGALAVGVPVLACALAKGGIGGGDIKLFCALGFAYGWCLGLVVLFLSCALTVVVGLVAYLRKRGSEKASPMSVLVPMGPQIAVAFLVTLNLFKM